MWFFDRRQWGEEERREQSRQRLADGELPLEAEARIYNFKRIAAGKREAGFFSSGLTPSALALTASHTIRPIAQVTGSAVYQLGWNPDPLASSSEMEQVTVGLNDVRRRALDRLTVQTTKLAAHGVAGIEVHRRLVSHADRPSLDQMGLWKYEDLRHCTVEVTVHGTALAWANVRPQETPFLSTLSVIDLTKLLEAGYLPAGIVAASSVWYQIGGFDTRWALQSGLGRNASWYNTELKDYTRAFYEAKERAIVRVQRQAADLTATGVVNVSTTYSLIDHEIDFDNQGKSEKRHDLIVELDMIGDAIRELRDKPIDARHAVNL